MSDLSRAVVLVDGHVQGVGFRWWVARQAGRLGLTGSATNLDDGRVEVDVQGGAADVDTLIGLLSGDKASGRPGHVSGASVERRTPEPDRSGFDTA